MCLQTYIADSCGCYDLTLPILDFSVPCNSSVIGACAYFNLQNFYINQASECFKKCPEECESINFKFEQSYGDFPSPFYSKILQQTNIRADRNFDSFEDIKATVLAVNIYFDEIAYAIIEEVPTKSAATLFADIGGIFGLCVGASMLIVMEVLELIFRIFLAVFFY